MSHVDWTDGAMDNLREVVQDSRISRELLCLAWTELREHPDPDDEDEGHGSRGLLWRRGISRDRRRSLEPNDLEADAAYEAWDFVLIYRMRNLRERQRHLRAGFVVLAVVPNTQMYGEYLQVISPSDG